MSQIGEQSPQISASKSAGRQVFSCLEQLLAFHARTAPGQPAILSADGGIVTYGELWARTNDVVQELRNLGIAQQDRVAVVLPRGAESAVVMVAIATGAVCVPFNPDFTASELQRDFGDLRIAALITRADVSSACRDVAQTLGIPVIDLLLRPGEGPGALSLHGPAERRAAEFSMAGAGDDAIILLTSGTTSRPKLVPLTHANVCLSAHNAGAVLALEPRDRLLNALPLYHAHGLISGLLTALAAGSSVICTTGFDAASFFGWLSELRPTWYTAVPAIHQALLAAPDHLKRTARPSSLRIVRSASSSLPPSVLDGLEALFGVPVIETYGMTEGASQIAANPKELRKKGSVGLPTGPEIAIMDPEGLHLPPGDHGEIALRGPTITRGYDNDDAATEAAFRNGWFRTGDLGYFDPDGYLFIVGRIKDIINRGGQKVSPVEVEGALLNHPDVVDAGVFAIPHRRLGEGVAAIIVLRTDSDLSTRAIRDFLRKRLAPFKMPGAIRTVPEIPKGAGGKIKRGELLQAFLAVKPKTDGNAKASRLGSELESELAAMWAELLELGKVGIDQDVFALGADSLTVTQMLSRLRERYGVELSFEDIFDAPTVAALAARLTPSTRDRAAPSPASHDSVTDAPATPLSFQQQRIYVLGNLDPTRCSYNVVEVVRFLGPLDVEALESGIEAICERYEILRTTFSEPRGNTAQTVGTLLPRIEHLDLGPCAKNTRAAAIRRQALEFSRIPFELESEPPLQIQLLRLDAHDHALVTKFHHLATDGWSQRLFWQELEMLYTAGRGSTAVRPTGPACRYRDFVDWQRNWLQTSAARQQQDYWRKQLEALTDLPLRTDWPRPETATGRGARHPLKFSRALTERLNSLSRSQGATLYMTLLAAFQCLLCRYTDHSDVAIGSLIANRNQMQFEHLIGMFANTIVMRTDLSGDPTFKEALRRVRQVTFDAYRNQDLPIEEILRDMKVARSPDRTPLFQVMFVLQNGMAGPPTLPGLSAQFLNVDPGIARFDLTLELAEVAGCLTGWFEYSTDLFEGSTIARTAGHLRTLLQAVVTNPELRISRLPLLPASERRRVLTDWNDTEFNFRRHGSFAQRFARQSQRTPKATAISAGQERLSYRELARRSSAIARRLVLESIGPEKVVALLTERDVNLAAAISAVQQVGGVFLCLDPALPAARLAAIVRSSGTQLLLAGRSNTTALKELLARWPIRERARVLLLEDLLKPTHRRRGRRPARATASDLAYLIYTSGSTGTPKGVMIEQSGLANHLNSLVSELKLSAADVIAQTAPQSFVISVWQFLAGLMVGARIHICADEIVRDPILLAREIDREAVTVLQIVPSLLRQILERAASEPALRAFGRLRLLISTGEPLPGDLCQAWFRQFPGVPLINAYGSSECSDDVALNRLTAAPEPAASASIGRAIPNTRLYVLDSQSQPAPIGLTGELCVGGVAVGRGYLNDPEQTRQRFMDDPFSTRRGARLFRTGDLARWRADGVLECLGRLDQQVKIRGNRIELREVEYVLREHPDVQAAVVLQRDDTGGEARLVAHVVAASTSQPTEASDLRGFLKAKLPGYMIPADFIFLDRIPLNAHGKVDRSALLALPEGARTADRAQMAAPRDATEKILADIWCDLLKVETIGINDNFFDFGGHSLLAGQIVSRIASAFAVSLPIRAVFEASTIGALARRIDAAANEGTFQPAIEIARLKQNARHPVSIAQDQMMRIERYLPGMPQLNLPFAFRLKGSLNVAALKRSLVEVVRRHESLRTGFSWSKGQPVASVKRSEDIVSLLAIENMPPGKAAKNSRAKALQLKRAKLRGEQEAWTPFDLTRAPLLRARLLRLADDDHVLLMTMHHIVADGWSIGVLFEELSKLHAAFANRRPDPLPQPGLQFSAVSRWESEWCATDAAARQFAYWNENLRDAPPIFAGGSSAASIQLSPRSAHEPVDLPKDLIERLGAYGRSQGGTLFMTLLTGLKSLLVVRTGRKDVCVATAMANRTQPGTERTIGPFENTTIIRTAMDPDLPFREAFSRVRHTVLEAYARQEIPFDVLAERLSKETGLDPTSLLQVYFTLQNPLRQPLELSGIVTQPFGNLYREGQPVMPIDHTWLSLMLKERPSGVTGSCIYKPDLFNQDAVIDWMKDFDTILCNAITNPEASLGSLLGR